MNELSEKLRRRSKSIDVDSIELANIPSHWKKILKEAGVRKKDLKDPITRKLVSLFLRGSFPPVPHLSKENQCLVYRLLFIMCFTIIE